MNPGLKLDLTAFPGTSLRAGTGGRCARRTSGRPSSSPRWRLARRTCSTRTPATASPTSRTWAPSSAATSAPRSWSTRHPTRSVLARVWMVVYSDISFSSLLMSFFFVLITSLRIIRNGTKFWYAKLSCVSGPINSVSFCWHV